MTILKKTNGNMPSERVKNFTFTLEDCLPGSTDRLKKADLFRYMIVREIAKENGDIKMEGYGQCFKRLATATIAVEIAICCGYRPLISAAAGNWRTCYDRITAWGDTSEWGVPIKGREERSDIGRFLTAAVKLDDAEMAKTYPAMWPKYSRAAQNYRKAMTRKPSLHLAETATEDDAEAKIDEPLTPVAGKKRKHERSSIIDWAPKKAKVDKIAHAAAEEAALVGAMEDLHMREDAPEPPMAYEYKPPVKRSRKEMRETDL